MTLLEFLQQRYTPQASGENSLAIRVDDRNATDMSISFCTVTVRIDEPTSNDFQIILHPVPWNEYVEAKARELRGTWSKTRLGHSLSLYMTITSISDIRSLAEAIRKVTGRGRRYPDPNWKWVAQRTADTLHRFADSLREYRHCRRNSQSRASITQTETPRCRGAAK